MKEYKDLYDIQSGLDLLGYKIDNFSLDIGLIIAIGIFFRILALVMMILLNRDKKK